MAITSKNIENMALYYLQRYSAPSPHFKKIMKRKIKRRCENKDIPFLDEYNDLLDEVTEKLEKLGYINDANYINRIIRSGYKSGYATNKIKSKLIQKGLDTKIITSNLEIYRQEQNIDPEFIAGIRHIKKKKLGCFTKTPNGKQAMDKQKMLQRMAYAGYSYEMSNKLLGLSLEEAETIFYRQN